MSREVERKYAVDDEFAVPELSGRGPVASVGEAQSVELVATYYDTPDLRLARERVTLRRRTGGHDAGWTLKLPAAGDPEGRDELAAPLGLSRTPPPDLLDLVTAWVRGAELAPVGELTTARTARLLRDADGRALAELVDDRVTVTGHGEAAQGATVFREVEVELCDGADRSVLDVVGKALVAAGAVAAGELQPKLVRALGPAALGEPSPPLPAAKVRRRAPAGDLLTAYLRGQVRALLQQDARVRQDAEDAVHKARVASRRLRSALRTFAPLLDAEAVGGLGAELRWLARELGTARDAEVVLVRLRALVRSQPEEMVLGPVGARVDERLLSDLLLARESGLAAMREPRYVALLDRLVALATDPPLTPKAERPVSDVIPGRVLRAWRRLESRLAPATGDGASLAALSEEQLHEARKAAKRARYAAEAAALTYGEDALANAQVLADLQALLGEHQDAVVARRVLRDLGLAAYGAGENAFTYGWLSSREQAAAEAARAALPAVWDEAARARHRRWLAD